MNFQDDPEHSLHIDYQYLEKYCRYQIDYFNKFALNTPLQITPIQEYSRPPEYYILPSLKQAYPVD